MSQPCVACRDLPRVVLMCARCSQWLLDFSLEHGRYPTEPELPAFMAGAPLLARDEDVTLLRGPRRDNGEQ